MSHLNETELNDYVDGTLAGASVRSVEEHLHACASCREDVAALRRLLATAAALPLSLEPPANLWSRVRRETIDERPNRRHMLWELRIPLAAAALLLVTVASGVTWWVARDRMVPAVAEAPPTQGPVYPPNVTEFGLARAEADYVEAARTLLLMIEERRSRMNPEIVQTVEENVRVMNGAISTAKAALEADPTNRDVAAILNATYQSKVQMLKRAVQLSGEI